MSHRAQIDASVRKSHWNHGIATRMLTELLETGVRAGVTAFTLEVRADTRRPFMCMKSWAFARWGGWNGSFASTANTTPPC